MLGRGALLAAAADPRAAGPVMAQWCFLLALWGRCLDGTDLLPRLGRFRPGPETAYVMCSLPADLRRFEQRLAAARAGLPSPSAEAELRRLCVWTCKKLLRAGAELAMLHDGRFTRDLTPCARRFAERLPHCADAARHLLRIAIEPSSDLDVLERMVGTSSRGSAGRRRPPACGLRPAGTPEGSHPAVDAVGMSECTRQAPVGSQPQAFG